MGAYLKYVDCITLYSKIHSSSLDIYDIWKNISQCSEGELRFFWSIIKSDQEEEFDAYYER